MTKKNPLEVQNMLSSDVTLSSADFYMVETCKSEQRFLD